MHGPKWHYLSYKKAGKGLQLSFAEVARPDQPADPEPCTDVICAAAEEEPYPSLPKMRYGYILQLYLTLIRKSWKKNP